MVFQGWDYFACYVSLEIMNKFDIHDLAYTMLRNKAMITMEILLNAYLSVITRDKMELGGIWEEVISGKNLRL